MPKEGQAMDYERIERSAYLRKRVGTALLYALLTLWAFAVSYTHLTLPTICSV